MRFSYYYSLTYTKQNCVVLKCTNILNYSDVIKYNVPARVNL